MAVRSAEASSRVGLCSDTGHRCRSIHTDWAVPPHQIFFAFLDESESFKSKSNSKTRVNSCINHTYKVGKGGRKGGREEGRKGGRDGGRRRGCGYWWLEVDSTEIFSVPLTPGPVTIIGNESSNTNFSFKLSDIAHFYEFNETWSDLLRMMMMMMKIEDCYQYSTECSTLS